METAEHIDSNFHLGVEGLEFMRETRWGSENGEPLFNDGHPWSISDYMVEQGTDLLGKDWKTGEFYRNNKLVKNATMHLGLFFLKCLNLR